MKSLRYLILSLAFSYGAMACSALKANDAEQATINAPSESLRFFNAQNQDDADVPEFSEGYVNTGDSTLHYVTGGSGKLVVFYHGFPSYWYLWKHQLKALAKDYRVLAFDGLGANLSDKPNEQSAYAIDKLAKQLNTAINSLADQKPYVLIGHDWGGALAWAVAQESPPGLDKLIVLSAPPYNLLLELLQTNPDQIKASQYMERLKSADGEKRLSKDNAYGLWKAGGYEKFIERGLITKAEGELFRTALARPGVVTGGINWYRANIPTKRTLVEDDYWPSRSAHTSVDSMLIWGAADKTFVPEFLQLLPSYTKKLRIETLPGIGHTPQLETPTKVTQLIQEFIESD